MIVATELIHAYRIEIRHEGTKSILIEAEFLFIPNEDLLAALKQTNVIMFNDKNIQYLISGITNKWLERNGSYWEWSCQASNLLIKEKSECQS